MRAIGQERTVARICREAGAVVRTNMKFRDMNIVCPANDDREIEVVASGLRFAARRTAGSGYHIAQQLLVVQVAPMLRTWCSADAELVGGPLPSRGGGH